MIRIFRKRYRRRKKVRFGNLQHIGTVCVAVVIACALLGVAYAVWNQSFDIFSSISTGNISIAIRDINVESSDDYETFSFNPIRQGNVVRDVEINVVTESNPFNMILVFTVENNGTVPVVCEGIDNSAGNEVDVLLLEAPAKIEPGQTGSIRVKLARGYCADFEFSSFVRFKQAT